MSVSRPSRPAPGGGRCVDVPPDRLTGWIGRFSAQHGGTAPPAVDPDGVTLVAGDGTTARIAVPYPPMSVGGREPVEAVLHHLAAIGTVGILLIRAGAHSVGICADRRVLSSSTDTHYVQGRTAAGGWSQQRYARRRGNQLTAAHRETADVAARVLLDTPLQALAVGGDRAGVAAVLTDPRLAALAALPRREFPDIAEPRRVVLDEVAERSLDVTIVITEPRP